MFFLKDSAKGRAVSLGVILGSCALLFFSIWILTIHKLSLFSLQAAVGIFPPFVFKGDKWAYTICRCIWGILFFAAFINVLNPVAYDDIVLNAHDSYWPFALGCLVFATASLTFYYCFTEHAKLRGLK